MTRVLRLGQRMDILRRAVSIPPWLACCFCLLAVVGVVFVYRVTPVSGIDEQFHFDRALQVSQGDFLAQRRNGRLFGGGLDSRMTRYAEYFEGQRDRRAPSDAAFAQRLSEQLSHERGTRAWTEFSSTATYSPVMYLPSAAALALAGAAGAHVETRFYAGRLGNLFGYLALLALVLAVLPEGRLGILALFSTPTCLHLAAAYSADPMTNGLALLYLACCLRFRASARLTGRHMLVLLGLAVVLGWLKITCAIISLACFLVPSAAFPSRRDWLISCCAIVGASLVAAVVWNGFYPFMPADYWQTGGDPHAALGMVVHHPWHIGGEILRALRGGAAWWWEDIYGRFGGGPPPQFFKIDAHSADLALGCIALLALTERKNEAAVCPGVALGALAFVHAALILLAFYIAFTPLAPPIITGVQGRYFLLAAGTVYLGCVTLLPRWVALPRVSGALVVLCCGLTLHVAVDALGPFAANWH